MERSLRFKSTMHTLARQRRFHYNPLHRGGGILFRLRLYPQNLIRLMPAEEGYENTFTQSDSLVCKAPVVFAVSHDYGWLQESDSPGRRKRIIRRA